MVRSGLYGVWHVQYLCEVCVQAKQRWRASTLLRARCSCLIFKTSSVGHWDIGEAPVKVVLLELRLCLGWLACGAAVVDVHTPLSTNQVVAQGHDVAYQLDGSHVNLVIVVASVKLVHAVPWLRRGMYVGM